MGEVSALPYPDGSFAKAWAVHSMHFWPSLDNGLRELHRVLRPDGLLMLAVRMRRDDVSVLSPSRYGLSGAQIDEIVAPLDQVGFRDASSRRQEIGQETIAVIGARLRAGAVLPASSHLEPSACWRRQRVTRKWVPDAGESVDACALAYTARSEPSARRKMHAWRAGVIASGRPTRRLTY